MAPPSFLSLNYRHSGALQPVRILNGTTTSNIGGTLPDGALITGTENFKLQMQSAVHFRGQAYIAHGGFVFKHNIDSDTWETILDTAAALGLAILPERCGGLHIAVDSDGISKLWFWQNVNIPSAIRFVGWKYDGEIWANPIQSTNDSFTLGIGREILYRRELFISAGRNGGEDVAKWNVGGGGGTITTFAVSSIASCAFSADFDVFKGRLLYLCAAPTNDWEIFELIAGAFTSIHTLTLPEAWTNITATTAALFNENGKVYAIVPSQDGSAAQHWNCFELTVSGGGFSEADITSTVLPADWRDGGAKTGVITQVNVFVDNETDPTTPTIHIYHLSDDSSSGVHTYYPWNGPGSVIGAGVGSVSSNYMMPNPNVGGGGIFYNTNDFDAVWTEDPAAVSGGNFTRKFVGYGDPLILSHGSVTSGPFELGETVTGGTSSATGVVVSEDTNELRVGGVIGTFQDAEVLTGGSSGATATTDAAPTGRDEDHMVKIFHNTDEEGKMTQTPLAAVSGESATLNGDTIEDLFADGVTEYLVTMVGAGFSEGQQITNAIQIIP